MNHNAESVATQAASIATAYFKDVGNQIDQYPSAKLFDSLIHNYLEKLSIKKRDKALVDSERYSKIFRVLKDPKNTTFTTAQFRFWVKKMFYLSENKVCHDDKPVATRENIYSILVAAHKESLHGGRDKTSALVRRQYSWIPKELIARFVRHCPYCISKRNGNHEPKTPPFEWNQLNYDSRMFFTEDKIEPCFQACQFRTDATNSCAAAAAIITAAAMAAIKSNSE